MWATQYLELDSWHQLITSGGLGTMGFRASGGNRCKDRQSGQGSGLLFWGWRSADEHSGRWRRRLCRRRRSSSACLTITIWEWCGRCSSYSTASVMGQPACAEERMPGELQGTERILPAVHAGFYCTCKSYGAHGIPRGARGGYSGGVR